MVKDNYTAWQINNAAFDNSWSDEEKLIFFARYGILAPSGHNTQPWELTIHNNSLSVGINKRHYLSADGSGLLSVEPYISLGTFIEVYRLAALGFGYEIKIRLFPHKDAVAGITIQGRLKPEPSLLEAITTRVSNRTPYKKTPVDKKLLSSITAHDFSGVKCTVITNRKDIDFVAHQTGTAIASIMSRRGYRKELSTWVRTNNTRKYDGMPGFTHGFGNFQALLSKPAVRYVAKKGPQAQKSTELIKHSSALVMVRCTDNERGSFVNAGRLYSQVCVLANHSSLATSALGAAVIDPGTREKIKQYFNLDDRPIYILRIGTAQKHSQHSPRWPLEKVLH